MLRTHASIVAEFAAELARRDPDGRLIAQIDDAPGIARGAADVVIDAAKAWTDHLGGFYDVEGVRRILGRDRPISRQAVHQRRGLLSLATQSGRIVYPRFQFVDGSPLPGLDAVLEVLPEALVSRWTVASWLISPDPGLAGERPVDLLRERHIEVVVAAANDWSAALAA